MKKSKFAKLYGNIAKGGFKYNLPGTAGNFSAENIHRVGVGYKARFVGLTFYLF